METLRVLIADDHPLFRDGLRALLMADPAAEIVGEAATGEEAVALAAELQPDVILMDLQMPGLDGIEATRRIVMASPHIRVLVVTMFSDDLSVFGAMRAGARGYMLKGASHAEMLAAIRSVASGAAIFSPQIAHCVSMRDATLDLLMTCLLYFGMVLEDPSNPTASILNGEYRLWDFAASYWLSILRRYLSIAHEQKSKDLVSSLLSELESDWSNGNFEESPGPDDKAKRDLLYHSPGQSREILDKFIRFKSHPHQDEWTVTSSKWSRSMSISPAPHNLCPDDEKSRMADVSWLGNRNLLGRLRSTYHLTALGNHPIGLRRSMQRRVFDEILQCMPQCEKELWVSRLQVRLRILSLLTTRIHIETSLQRSQEGPRQAVEMFGAGMRMGCLWIRDQGETGRPLDAVPPGIRRRPDQLAALRLGD